MNWLAVERAAWTLGVGGFLAVLVGSLVAPDPTAFWPYAVGSLVVGLPVAHWYLDHQLDELAADRAGRLTLFFLVLFGSVYVGFRAVELVAVPDSVLDLAGRVVVLLVALSVARRTAGRDGE
ncbi:hypothetical protein [Halorussus halobius]|uniref:hypothetical protein n=1 Tax=Halorussus halobius TaxID=1710537 RepID=UPI0010922F29|nr:hypothetical protein [Halorussus halobius]